MGIINKPATFSPSTTISSSEVNDNFDTIYNEFNGSIAAANLATDAVTTAKIANVNVTTAKIADLNVTTDKLAAAAVTPTKWTNTYKFSASGSSTGLGASTTALIGYAEVFDTGSNFDPVTGLFTAPVAGYYQFTGCVIIGTSNGAVNVGRLFARKNGSDVRTCLGWVTPAVTGVTGGSFTFFLQLAANDTAGIAGLVSSGGATPSEGRFEGFLVSAT